MDYKTQNKKEADSRRRQVILDLTGDALYVPLKEKEMAAFLQVAKEDREDFHRLLQELLTEGKLILTSRGKYQKAEGNAWTGTFIGNARGFGFVEIEGCEEDYFIPEEYTGGAFHQDTVQIAPLGSQSGRRREAKVVKILTRGITQLVGTYEQAKSNSFGFVIPDNPKIARDVFVPGERSKGAVTGHKVVLEITDYGKEGKNPEGQIIEILGHMNDPGVDIMSIVRGYELPVSFSDKVMNQAARVGKEVTEADREGRRDLRDVQMITIDGEDAKDLDDAVSLRRDGEKYYLGVHIADVANYVQENSALDREALKRGTSVYLVDRVIPMLPHVLSNGICSLNEGEDRLALSCLMTIDKKGGIVDYEICESVIRVDRRMSYTVVKELLEEDAAKRREDYAEYAPLLPMLKQMEELAAILRKKRRGRGSVDFDFPECSIKLDAAGKPLEIQACERNTATRIIEDFMLAANETVAQHFYWQEIPFVYRVHGVPDNDRLQKLTALIRNFGYYMKTLGRNGSKVGSAEIHPMEIQKLLDHIEGTPEEAMISRMVLRSMQQAKYSVECSGHFGLACRQYCHFTSPIRRYPDLQIHRIIKEQLRGRLEEKRIGHYKEILPEVAKQSSAMERRADEAERETDKLKKVEYMEGHIGEEYDGVISGVTAWGIYVELENTVEGLIHVSRLPGDYYIYHESSYEMKGEATGRSYKLGMPVRIRVEACDRFTRTIDFGLAEESL